MIQYQQSILINKPIDMCWELMDNPDNLKKWQPNLISFKQIEGKLGEEGSKMEMVYKNGKKEMTMIETIVINDGPELYEASYDMKGVHNRMVSRMQAKGKNQTLWTTEQEFEFNNFFMRIMAFVFKGAFLRQTQKIQQQFKEFAESQD